MARIVVFHTSDLHNKLRPEDAARLRDLKQQAPGSLMLDSGDAIWSGNVYWRPGGEPILDLMNSVPYDALCMGNREFHFLATGIEAKTSRARFPILSANLRDRSGEKAHPSDCSDQSEFAGQPARSCAIFERGGIRVGIFGLSVPCVTERMLVKKVSDYYFEQPLKSALEVVPWLRPQCDLLIALTHIGIQQDRQLAASVDGIDVILGGHTHTTTEPPERAGDTWLLHSGFYGHSVSRALIDVTEAGVDVACELIPLART